jgi:hypothetical protein
MFLAPVAERTLYRLVPNKSRRSTRRILMTAIAHNHKTGWGNKTDRTSERNTGLFMYRQGGQHKVFEVVLQRPPCRLPRVRQHGAKDRAAPNIEKNRGADGTTRWVIVLLVRISFRVGLMQYHLQDVPCCQRCC